MALYFFTSTPNKLLQTFKKAIDDGHVDTWSYDADGDFTHTPSQWANEAWLRPKSESDRLTFNILKPKNKNITKAVYGVYHGRFIESMLAHCDTLFDTAQATAKAQTGDIVA